MSQKVFLLLVFVGCLTAVSETQGSTILADDNIVFRPVGSGWFLSHNPVPYVAGTAPVTSQASFGLAGDAPLVGDVDGDGLDDIVVTRPAGAFSWFASHTVNAAGMGNLQGPGVAPLNSSLAGFGTVAGSSGNFLADVNGDGADDALTINAGFNWFANLSGLGTGLGAGPTNGPAQFGLAGDQPIVGDFNGDGRQDIGVYRQGAGNIFWNGTGAGGVLGGVGLGPIGQIGGAATDSLLIGNLNGDAFDDAVMVRQDGAGLIEWFGLINDGTGFLDFFNAGTTIRGFGLDGTDVPFLADINGDGLDDIGINRSGTKFVTYTTAGGALGTNANGDTNWAFGLPTDIQLFGDFNTVIPEPSSLVLVTFGALGLVGSRRRRV